MKNLVVLLSSPLRLILPFYWSFGFFSWSNKYRLFRGTHTLMHLCFHLALQLLCTSGLIPSSHVLLPSYLFLVPFALEALTFLLDFLLCCHHNYLQKELSFLPAPSLFFFFPRENKVLNKDSFDEMARNTTFLHWHFGNIAQWFGTYLFLLSPSIFALWILTFAALTSHSVLLHFSCLAARFGLLSLIYCI